MDNKTSQTVIISIIVLVIATLIYLIYNKERGKATTGGGTISVQDLVNKATPAEQQIAKTLIDSFKNNSNDLLSQDSVDKMLTWSDNQLSWGATYYSEQTGRTLAQDLKELPIWGWSSLSFSDNELYSKLEKLGLN